MAHIMECSRCEKQERSIYSETELLVNGVNRLHRLIDLCERCQKDVVTFIETPITRKSGGAML